MTWETILIMLSHREATPTQTLPIWTYERANANDRDLLKAFADELKRRLWLENSNGVSRDRHIDETINQLLTEAEVQQ